MPGLGFFNFGVPAAAVGVGAGSAGVGEWRDDDDDDDDDDDELLSQDAMSFPYSKLSLSHLQHSGLRGVSMPFCLAGMQVLQGIPSRSPQMGLFFRLVNHGLK